MRIKAKIGIAILGSLWAPTVACADPLSENLGAEQVKAEFSVEREVALGAPLLVEFKVQNMGGSAMAIDLGPYREAAFQLDVLGEAGVEHEGRWQLREGVGVPGEVVLEPGQEYVQSLIVQRWIVLENPGRYELRAAVGADVYRGGELKGPFYVGGRKTGRLEHEQVLVIDAREDQTLASEVCHGLERRALSRDAEVALPALEALSFASTEACLPTLKNVAIHAYQAPTLALDGIDRIGGEAGVKALMELLTAADEPLRSDILERLRRYCATDASGVSHLLEELEGQGCP